MWVLRSSNHPTQQDAVWLPGIARKYHNKKWEHFQPPPGWPLGSSKAPLFSVASSEKGLLYIGRNGCWLEANLPSEKIKERGNSDLNIHIKHLWLHVNAIIGCSRGLNAALVLLMPDGHTVQHRMCEGKQSSETRVDQTITKGTPCSSTATCLLHATKD